MKKIVALSALLLAAPMAANAGFYFGVGIGNATLESEGTITLTDEGNLDSFQLDDNDLSFNVNIGYDLTEHLAIDVAYQDWGKFSDDLGLNRAQTDLDMINLTLVAKLPLGDSFDLFGRAGVAFVNNDVDAVLFDEEGNSLATNTTSLDSEDLIYGVGADWNIGAGFSLRAEIDWVEITGFSKARNLSLSALYNFDI